jgi:hypothetical protein
MTTSRTMVGNGDTKVAVSDGGLKVLSTPSLSAPNAIQLQIDCIAAAAAAHISSRGVEPRELPSLQAMLPSSGLKAAS